MDVVDAAPALRKPPRVRAGCEPDCPPIDWLEHGLSAPAPRPRIRRIIANIWLCEHVSRRVAAILHADLRRAEAEIEADGGRGTDTALALAAELHRRIEAGPIDLRGSAPDLCRQLGLEVSDRAAREAVRRLAAHTLLVSAGSRHESAAVRLRSLWNRGTFELEADPLAWRHDPHGAISQWHAANLSQRSGDTCSPAYKERAGGDDVGDQDLEFDDLALLGVPRGTGQGQPASARLVASLGRRGITCPAGTTQARAMAAHRTLRDRWRSLIARMSPAELRRYRTPTTGGVLHQLDAADVGRLERKLSLAGLQAPSAARAAAIDEYVFERLGLYRMSLNIACGLASDGADDGRPDGSGDQGDHSARRAGGDRGHAVQGQQPAAGVQAGPGADPSARAAALRHGGVLQGEAAGLDRRGEPDGVATGAVLAQGLRERCGLLERLRFMAALKMPCVERVPGEPVRRGLVCRSWRATRVRRVPRSWRGPRIAFAHRGRWRRVPGRSRSGRGGVDRQPPDGWRCRGLRRPRRVEG